MKTKIKTILFAMMLLMVAADAEAQRPGSRRQPPASNQMVDSPLGIGDAGVAWYTTWETALKEAKRSNRPILFTSAATTCSNVSGVF